MAWLPGLLHRSLRLARMAQNCLFHELARIQEVLRLVMLTRPTAFRPQFDPEEIPNIPEQTIPNRSEQFSVAVIDRHFCAGPNFPLNLNASSRKRDVFQVGDGSPLLTGFDLPDQFYQFGT
jgi:hypothetical protein